jgi:uracil-DNA glycosylase
LVSDPRNGLDNPKTIQPDTDRGANEILLCQTNSAKCSVNNPGNKQAHDRLFNNCREYIPGEIEALRPDIIVSQGGLAGKAIDKSPFQKISMGEEECYCEKRVVSGRLVLRLHTYHANSYGHFFSRKAQCWERWADIAFDMFRATFPGQRC